ncbi:hypothetical protein NEMIN01_2456 [Nematocida minor]|uniref:uncharacterized protein n=1 Tax=Nematocida minor TaxID=1912983 RepID=UPI00221F041C|nr:uncharacterized protein NEMIN01_2456 [Nematocida minor]KAI5193296.1 hypothetical protein NEMIN01_2456 [Nematocida minor]
MKLFVLVLSLTYFAAAISSKGNKKISKNIAKKPKKTNNESHLEKLMGAIAGTHPSAISNFVKKSKKQALKKKETYELEAMLDGEEESQAVESTPIEEESVIVEETIKEEAIEEGVYDKAADEITSDMIKTAKVFTLVTIEDELSQNEEVLEDMIADLESGETVVTVEKSNVEAGALGSIEFDLDFEEIKKTIGNHVMSEEESALLYKVTEEIEKNKIAHENVLSKMVQTLLLEVKEEDGTIRASKILMGMYTYTTKETNPLRFGDFVTHVFKIVE